MRDCAISAGLLLPPKGELERGSRLKLLNPLELLDRESRLEPPENRESRLDPELLNRLELEPNGELELELELKLDGEPKP